MTLTWISPKASLSVRVAADCEKPHWSATDPYSSSKSYSNARI